MLKSDQALWERELAEHMAQYLDDPILRDELSPPTGPANRGMHPWLFRLLLWTPVAVVAGTVGWSIGWYVI